MHPLNLSMHDQTLSQIKLDLEHQLQELRMESHIKDERILKLQMSYDQTLKQELQGILSNTQYDKVKSCLGDNYATIPSLDTSNFFTQDHENQNPNQHPAPVPYSPNLPLQRSTLLKPRQQQLDLQTLVNSQASSIEAMNQRERLLQEREKSL